MRNKTSLLCFVASIGLLLASHASAKPTVDVAYKPSRLVNLRADVAIADSAALDGAINAAISSLDTEMKQTFRVSVRFTTPSATCVVYCIRGHLEGTIFQPLGMSKATAMADGTHTIHSLYVAQDIAFDTGGFDHCQILFALPSAGAVDGYGSTQ